ncbi:MAG TPA: DUF1990 domain-containing protein [Streptomyces sp.]|nr:DUF1990 domain-containing protein [Streptomyces sp.]
MAGDFTYTEVGAALEAGPAPAGYRPMRVRTRIGEGAAVFDAAARAVAEWRMHRAMGVVMDTDAPHAEPGVRVVVGLGAGPLRLRAPCRVITVVAEERRRGWSYGTLPGHPECGEEAFVVSLEADDEVWLTVLAFSRPGVWWTRLAGPLVPVLQRAYARRCGAVLRRLVRA